MKKFLTVGALAIVAAAFFHQHAFAWKNTHFSIGLNWSCQSGGNNLLWGVFRNGQPGEPDWGCHGGYITPPSYPMMSAPAWYPPVMNQHAYAPAPAAMPAVPQAAPQPSRAWYNYPGYETVNYAPAEDYGYSYMFP